MESFRPEKVKKGRPKHEGFSGDDKHNRRKIRRDRDAARRIKTEKEFDVVVDELWSLWDETEDSTHLRLQEAMTSAEWDNRIIRFGDTKTFLLHEAIKDVPLEKAIRIPSLDDDCSIVCILYKMDYYYGLLVVKGQNGFNWHWPQQR